MFNQTVTYRCCGWIKKERSAGLSCSHTFLVLTDLSTHAVALRSNGQCAEPPRMVPVSHIELRGKRGRARGQRLFVRRQSSLAVHLMIM